MSNPALKVHKITQNLNRRFSPASQFFSGIYVEFICRQRLTIFDWTYFYHATIFDVPRFESKFPLRVKSIFKSDDHDDGKSLILAQFSFVSIRFDYKLKIIWF